MPKYGGIIVNTVESLEKGVLNAILDGHCTPGERTVPRIYSLGPLIVSGDGKSSGEVEHECMNWLDSKPKSSVVFLSFGSIGKFSGKQLRQKLIKVTLVEELKVALPVLPAEEDGIVSAAELEKRLTELMDSESEEGKALRERVMSARQVLLTAYSQDGPSRIALANFVESFKDNEPFQP
ncbi:hypothetical protein QYF36_023721 [Acer negundo]|nr:hypothetical protein QYF36_023721 [Acer negundo]